MANISWLVQSCCNPSVINYVEDSPVLSEGVAFTDSLGNCYTVVEQSEEIPTIFFTNRETYVDCLKCTDENPCPPPGEKPKKWLVKSCCEKGVTKIIADNVLIPGDIFQDINGNCYTVLTATSGAPNIVRENTEIYGTCEACKPCVSPSPSVTPSITQTPAPTLTVTPTITVTPSSTTYPLFSKTPTPTPTATISVTPSPTVSVGSPECKCITFTNTSISSSFQCFYTDCGGFPNAQFSISPQETIQVCGSNPSAGNPAVTFYTGSACIGEQCVTPDISPTPTPTPSATSVSGSTVDIDDLCMDVTFGPAPTPSTTPTATVSITPTATVSTSTFPIFPSISPTPTISVTPSITPTKTPTISVSSTPSVTPSVTPTRTVTPTISVTATPTVSITPTKTPTPTPTQNSGSIVVSECSTLLIDTSGKTYAYNSATNVSTLLPLPITFSSDIAHTTSKLWLVTATPTGPNIIEYNITLSPFTATYNRTLPLPVGYTIGAGMCAINNTTLISSVFPPFSTEQIVQITLNPDNTTTLTTLFNQIPGRRIAGDIIYTTNNKIILTTYTDAPFYYYISQYTLVNGIWTLEFDLNITNTSPLNLGLATINGGIYTFSNTNINQINIAFPYNVTQINNTGIVVAGASQVPSCNNVSFQPNVIPASPSPSLTPTKTVTPSITVSPSITPSRTPTPTPSPSAANSNCTGKLPLPGGSLVYNGVVVTASGTGALTLYPNYLASCNVTSQTNTISLGSPGPLLPFSYTLTFSQPVNNIKLIITFIDGTTPNVENFTFTTNAGTPTILSNDSCFVSISGNTITGTGTNGGGTFAVSAPSSYTTLTVTGFGGGGFGNTPMSIDCNSIAPFQSSCASCDIQSLPVGGNGTVVSNNVTLTTTYSGPQIPTYIAPNPTQMTCVGLASPSPYQTVVLGYNSGAFIYTINFSQPVNNIKFLINGAGSSFNPTAFEYFTFNTNAGVPTLTSCGPSCGTTINNNTLQMGLVLPYGGGILAQVSAPSNYTQIIITGPGGLQGSTFALCADTAIPLPSPSPSITPSVTTTPSRTPSVTATPSISISKTPSVTVSPSKTPSLTPSPSPGFAAGCNIIYYKTINRQYYSYNFTTNTSTLLSLPASPTDSANFASPTRAVIANTSNKLWSYVLNSSPGFNPFNIVEYNIVNTPFSATINRYIALPKIENQDVIQGKGLFAINNTKLIGTIQSIGNVNLGAVYSEPLNSITQYANGVMVVEYDITTSPATWQLKAKLSPPDLPVGGLLLTTNNKLLITTAGSGGNIFLCQFDYITGTLEFRKQLSPTITGDCSLAEVNGNIYIMGYNIYKVDTVAPYNLTLVQTTGNQLVASSQLASCIDTSFNVPICAECTPAPLKLVTPVTYNGVTIIPTYTGPAATDNSCPLPSTACFGENVIIETPLSAFLGNINGNYTYKLTFSQPVNNIKIQYMGTNRENDLDEVFTWNTNGGTPTITLCKGCFQTINGNVVTGSNDYVSDYYSVGGGMIVITAPSNYTELTLTAFGRNHGTVFTICSNSVNPIAVSPSPSPTPSVTKTPTPTPSVSSNNNLLGCVYYNDQGYLYNYDVVTNTSSPPITLSNIGAVFSQNDTHTSTKYWKANNTNLIQEWVPTNNPTVLALNRNISINTGYTYFLYSCAVNDTTLLAALTNNTNGSTTAPINAVLARINITNNTITPAQVTPLFNIGSADNSIGFGSMLLTSTNKILYAGTRFTSNFSIYTYLRQYSYPDGALELEINLSSIVPSGYGQYIKLFETGGNIFFSLNVQPNLNSTSIYQINLTSPYSATLINTLPGLKQGFNSSLNCNTVNFNVAPAPSPTPSPSPSAPSSAFRTIYKYLDIQ